MSDSNKLSSGSLIVGTAGHIDHGKTSLVRALTGIDTDRLAEEKQRGISIDLGFAHKTLPSGALLSFVDVPGHENFIKNMLAGATGIAAVMLVVAADEGVKPQTREHFGICRLLGVRAGLVAVSKFDAVDSERFNAVAAEIRQLCSGSFLEGKPILPVSAKTGSGIDALISELEQLVTQDAPRSFDGLVRLPIDRSFVLTGFGTVVTGTLAHGRLQVGDSVVIYPGALSARIRGLQQHGKPVDHARARERTAVNLSGVDHRKIARGAVLVHPGDLDLALTIDASIEWLDPDAIPLRRSQFLLHAGTSEIPVSLKCLDPNGSLARLRLSRPALMLPDDRFVLRKPSPASTVAGGVVVDAFPPLRLNRLKTRTRLQSFAQASWPERVQILVNESPGGRRVNELVRRTGLSPEQLQALISQGSGLTVVASAGRVFSSAWLVAQRGQLKEWLRDFHERHPHLAGAPLSHARRNLEPAVARAVMADFAAVRINGDTVALSDHKPQASREQNTFLLRLEQTFRQAGYQPPLPADVFRSLGADPGKSRSLLESLIKSNRLVRITEDLIFHADVVQHIRGSLSAHKGRRFSVPEFKEWTQISRKYAIPLLEYLDRQRVTKRDGDARVVL